MKRPSGWAIAAGGVGGLALAAACIPLDAGLYPRVLWRDALQHDWYQVFRQLGNLLTWVLIAAVVLAADARRLRAEARPLLRPLAPGQGPAVSHRAGLILLAPALAGGAAEVVKVLCGRSRPVPAGFADAGAHPALLAATPGEAPFLGPFPEGAVLGLGFPSSHAAVAFAGATALGLLLPGTLPPLLAVAASCAATRLFAGAHSVSDVLVGAAMGVIAAAALHRLAHRSR